MDEQKELHGRIEKVIFKSSNSWFAICAIQEKETGTSMTVKGLMPEAAEGQNWKLKGHYIQHPKYGRQFEVESGEIEKPVGEEALAAFFSGSRFEGVGKKTARRIVESLGENALDKIMEDPDCLDGLVKPSVKETITAVLRENGSLSSVVTTLLEWGLSEREINLLSSSYEDVMEALEQDCFDPLYNVRGFGYEGVMKLAAGLKVDYADLRRLEAALYDRACSMSMNSGSTAIPLEHLFGQFGNVLTEDLQAALTSLEREDRLLERNGFVYPWNFYDEERRIALKLFEHVFPVVKPEAGRLEEQIEKVEKKLAITYDPLQKQAIESFFDQSIMILNGGPGTGKSTTVRGILEILKSLYPASSVQLCAPTGRAAKRLAQLSDSSAKTIHSLLQWEMESDSFARDYENPLSCDFLILDEFSIVDTHLFCSLLEALPRRCRILLIGDEDQLPSVSPGKVMQDLIASKTLPIVHLETLFRQSGGSGIARLAAQVRQEQPLKYESGVSFHSLPAAQILPEIEQIVTESEGSMQILAPMYKGSAGIDEINRRMQEILNPFSVMKPQIVMPSITYRLGDRVLLKKNMPEQDVFNGDLGEIIEVDEASRSLVVDFEGTEVSFEHDIPLVLTHAWCISIHKSQGSEYQNVCLVADAQASRMLNRRLLYTGLSRAKKNLHILGSQSLFEKSVKREDRYQRSTTLVPRLQEVFD